MKITAIILMAVFYAAYLGKKFSQKRKGILTNQIAVGNKPQNVIMVEKIMGVATFLIIPVELISIASYPKLTLVPVLRDCMPMQIAGVVIAALGVLSFIVAMLTMADSWRAGIPDKDRTAFVQHGIYRMSRNPAFVGFDLMYLGLLVAFPNVIHLVCALLAVVMLHLQILNEEKFCAEVFGKEYEDYSIKVRRYL